MRRVGRAVLAGVLVTLLAGVGGAQPALAARADEVAPPPTIEIDLAPPLVRTMPPGGVAIGCEVENRGEAPFSGDLQVRVGYETRTDHVDENHLAARRSLELRPGDRRRLHLVVPVPRNRSVHLQVIGDDGEVRRVAGPGGATSAVRHPVDVRNPYRSAHVSVCSPPSSPSRIAAALGSIDGADLGSSVSRSSGIDSVNTGEIGPGDLPDRWFAYGPLDLLVLHDVAADDLSPPVREAIGVWVRQVGGHVLVVPGSDGLDGELVADLAGRSLAPEDASGLDEREIRVVRWTLEPGRGARELGDPGLEVVDPVVRVGVHGSGLTDFQPGDRIPAGWGTVDVLAVDPTDEALEVSRATMEGLWSDYLRSLAPHGGHAFPGLAGWDAGLPAHVLDPDTRPSTFLIALLVAVYVLAVGPGLYLFLKARGLEARLVVAIPAASIAFTLLFIACGYVSQGVTTRVRTLSVVWMPPGASVGLEETITGVYPAVPGGHEVRAGPGRSLRSIDRRPTRWNRNAPPPSPLLEDGERPAFPDLPLHQWELGMVQAIGPRDLGGAIERTGGLLRNGTHHRILFAFHPGRRYEEDERGAAALTEPLPPGEAAHLTSFDGEEGSLATQVELDEGSLVREAVESLATPDMRREGRHRRWRREHPLDGDGLVVALEIDPAGLEVDGVPVAEAGPHVVLAVVQSPHPREEASSN